MAIDYRKLKTVRLSERRHKVSVASFGKPSPSSVRDFVETLPDVLAGRELREILAALVEARRRGAARIWAFGAHVVKTGVTPYLADLMRRGYITHIAINGAGVIHDFEIARVGSTSEVVEDSIADGSFGMAIETAEELGAFLGSDVAMARGLGPAVSAWLDDPRLPHRDQSLLAQANRHGVGVSVHLMLGADVLHYHPQFDWSRVAAGARRDFDLFVEAVGRLDGGGIHLNVGSAVLLPEVFLKAVTVNRNLGRPIDDFSTVVLDMLDNYRPRENVLQRPGGKPHRLLGHHEIMIPLIASALPE